MTASTTPTSTVSPSCTLISVRVPLTGDGTSESTLSVDTSKSGSSSATESPTSLNHFVIVPSVTVSPSWGIVMSAICGSSCGYPCRARPVRLSIASPSTSAIVGWGWIRYAMSSTVASQLTAR